MVVPGADNCAGLFPTAEILDLRRAACIDLYQVARLAELVEVVPVPTVQIKHAVESDTGAGVRATDRIAADGVCLGEHAVHIQPMICPARPVLGLVLDLVERGRHDVGPAGKRGSPGGVQSVQRSVTLFEFRAECGQAGGRRADVDLPVYQVVLITQRIAGRTERRRSGGPIGQAGGPTLQVFRIGETGPARAGGGLLRTDSRDVGNAAQSPPGRVAARRRRADRVAAGHARVVDPIDAAGRQFAVDEVPHRVV